MDADELAMLNSVMDSAMSMGFEGEDGVDYAHDPMDEVKPKPEPVPPQGPPLSSLLFINILFLGIVIPKIEVPQEEKKAPVSVWADIESDELTQEDRDLLEFFKARSSNTSASRSVLSLGIPRY
jgi:hypothetical protein